MWTLYSSCNKSKLDNKEFMMVSNGWNKQIRTGVDSVTQTSTKAKKNQLKSIRIIEFYSHVDHVQQIYVFRMIRFLVDIGEKRSILCSIPLKYQRIETSMKFQSLSEWLSSHCGMNHRRWYFFLFYISTLIWFRSFLCGVALLLKF